MTSKRTRLSNSSDQIPQSPPSVPIEKVKPTAEEKRNGWKTSTLSQYVHSRNVTAGQLVYGAKPKVVMIENTDNFDPRFDWRV